MFQNIIYFQKVNIFSGATSEWLNKQLLLLKTGKLVEKKHYIQWKVVVGTQNIDNSFLFKSKYILKN